MNPNQLKQSSVRNFLKRNYKHYYIQNSNGEWEEAERLACVSYDTATSFTGKHPQRWYCDFESDYIVRLSRDKAGERLYNAVKYLRRKENRLIAEQFGCIGNDCPKCKGWEEVADGETKCERCSKKVVFVALDKNMDTDASSQLDLDSGIDISRQCETSYLIETLHKVLDEFSTDERKLWKCLAADMKKKDIALLFGWTEDKFRYRQTLLFEKLRTNKLLKDFFENR
ncbi:MAG: hypothetical protein LBK57_11185 [Clostridiales Family XIII bacterium]|jgi:hypothetical protein|nr:hypothetical protein [Clostridiales Family XIII bacterium]